MEFFAFLFPIVLFGGIVSLVMFLNRFFYKDLLAEFQAVSDLPANSVRLMELRYKNTRLRNAAKLGEEGDGMILKMMMLPPLSMPYASFSKIEHNGVFVVLTFKKKEFSSLHIAMTADQLKKFPRMMSHLAKGVKEQRLEEKEYSSALPVSKNSYTEAIPKLNPTQLKSSVGNWFRGVLLLIVIFAAFIYLRNRYGLGF